MKRVSLLSAALLLALGAAVAAGELLTIQLREATVRSGPKHFRPVVGTVKYGERIEVLKKEDGGWLHVRLPDQRTGYLHETATTEKPLPKLAPGTAGTQPGSVSRDEVALAGKGFNPQVERQYREDHRELEWAFQRVDYMEQRRVVDRAELERFLSEGQLGEQGRTQ
jgi:uncharacterized protein YgiM (DUF1202 family)